MSDLLQDINYLISPSAEGMGEAKRLTALCPRVAHLLVSHAILEAEIARLKADKAKLVEGLAPIKLFAEKLEVNHPEAADDTNIGPCRIGDVRNIARLLKEVG